MRPVPPLAGRDGDDALLCLLSLPRPGDATTLDAEAAVHAWCDLAGRAPAPLHPFVIETAGLAYLALVQRDPQRYCWADERDVIGRTGSRAAEPTAASGRDEPWIAPSDGWARLAPVAQRLLADVALLLDLVDRDGEGDAHDYRLRRADRKDLPLCLRRHREALDPVTTRRSVIFDRAGSSCVDTCVFALCPYPELDGQPYWAELSEPFCRRLRDLADTRAPLRRAPPHWQQMRTRQLRTFWGQMVERASGPRTRDHSTLR
jgi:hypothetical protein